MSEKSNSSRKSNSKKEIKDFEVPLAFKKQFLGFILIIFAFLVTASIFSYSSQDNNLLNTHNIANILAGKSGKIYNWLGGAGVLLSNLLVLKLFGYFSVIIPLLIILTGVYLIAKKSLVKVILISSYSILMMIILASSAGVLTMIYGGNPSQNLFCGFTGASISEFFIRMLGILGASVFFIFAFIIVLFLLLDSNIYKTYARLQLLWEKIKDKLSKEKTGLIEKKQLKKEIKEEKELSSLERERQKILSARQKKGVVKEEDLIKETEINRPKGIQNVQPEEELKPERRKKEIKLTETTQAEILPKTQPSETIINPENDNDIATLEARAEDDFAEEKLEGYKHPTLDLLKEPSKEEAEVITDEELTNNGRLLQEKLLKFGIQIEEKVLATPGPVVTLYELIPAADVKVSKIESLEDDIALALKAKGIRMIIPIPGKGTIGVEIPNRKSQLVRIKSILTSKNFFDSKKHLTIAFGKMIDGDVFIDDLSKMPHLLIAGATGSGKSVGINTIITSLLYKLHPSDLKFVMIDPKKIELRMYSKLRKHFLATSKDVNESIITSPSNAVSILKSVVLEMDQRYDKLANAGTRDIESYNKKYLEGKLKSTDIIKHRKLPYLVIIIDELADLMLMAKKDIEDSITRIAQMARAVGIHLIVATQRPSVDVITGLIKANFPVRIAYQVISKIDSRTILDSGGAEQLLRNGDMLFLSSETRGAIRIQNAFITSEECEKIVDHIANQKGFSKPYLLPSVTETRISKSGDSGDRDEMFEEAVRLVVKHNKCTVSTLQRRLKLGYARAARIVDQMELAGIVGPLNGANGRDVLIGEDEVEDYL
ncbi:MAG: DNA translocase FtsK 4TM domain-containing protein [Ignavibacteria bacterium]|nr:DNA translocase FtsK 4TM domain-containing protein [Ignavibacteria bacterium]